MATLGVNIKGLDQIRAKFGKEGQRALLAEISDELQVGAQDLRTRAVKRAPSNTGVLRAGIDVDGRDLSWIVYTVAEYAGYIEFGTKSKVQVPAEMKEEADKFRGKKGSYADFRQAISEWMRSKGIPPEALYPIMAKIMNQGIDPKPFMYPAMQEVDKYLAKEIDSAIQRFLNK
jgi:HK97 gp10 family phage protein